MKVVRRVTPGVHPEGEITRFLTERGFGNTAPLYGEVVRVDPDGTPNTLGLVQGFVRNQGDGWGWTLEFLERTIDDLTTATVADTEEKGENEADAFAAYDVFAAAIGKRLGELHAVFASPSDDPAFTPEPVGCRRPGRLGARCCGADRPRARHAGPGDGVAEPADRAAGAHRHQPMPTGCGRRRNRLAASGEGSLRTRVHGDFHLGQVLVVQADAYLIDFEGEPARTMEQRRAKSCAIRDVAGLLRSFDYAAAAALPGRVATNAAASGRRAELLQHFRAGAEAAFLDAYRAVLAQAPAKWVSPAGEAAMLDLFLLEKAAYEIRYEAANRPTWIGIPCKGCTPSPPAC